MPPRFSRLLSSKTFEIKSSNRSYFIHSGILTAEQSESLLRTTAGEVSDKIDLSDWDSDIVGLFAEFFYAGSYFIESSLEDEEDEEEEYEEARRREGVKTPDTVQSLADQERARDTNELLVHMKMYALAQYKSIKELQAMALKRFSTTLEEKNGEMLVEAEVIELLEYICSRTDFLANPGEPMRDLLLTFTAENIEKLIGWKGMGLLLDKGGSFMVELMEKLAGRLSDMGCDVAGKKFDLERELQSWKSRAEASEERVWLLEDINAKMWETATANEEKIQQLEIEKAEIEKKLETANAAAEELQHQDTWVNAEEGQQENIFAKRDIGRGTTMASRGEKKESEGTDWRTIRANREKTRELGVAKTQLSVLKAKVDSLEYKNKWLEALNAEKLRKPEDTDANAKMWESEARLEAKLGWFMASCPEKAQEYERLFPGL